MPAPVNRFKQSLLQGETLFGSWISLADGFAAEIMGRAGFDWLLIDGEHAPNDLSAIRDQVIALEASPSSVAVRVPAGETWIIKRVLDLGVQTVLVPIVETAEQARELARACRFPPDGTRGVGYGAARSGGFGQFENYGPTADAQICLLIQVETKKGLENLDEILLVDGVDGVFIGPADLSASYGFLGQTQHPDMQARIFDALRRIDASGKFAGTLFVDEAMVEASLDAGARFIAVGLDIGFLINGAKATAQRWITD
ncbi:MAG: HpcH/HpaI aldolase/citrate lyase family protein [Pseudomonadota bacterium]